MDVSGVTEKEGLVGSRLRGISGGSIAARCLLLAAYAVWLQVSPPA